MGMVSRRVRALHAATTAVLEEIVCALGLPTLLDELSLT